MITNSIIAHIFHLSGKGKER